MTEKKDSIFDQLNSAVLDFTEQVFGKKGRDFLESTQRQIYDFNVGAVRAWVNFTDQILKETKLGENEIIQKSNSTVKDLLRQLKILEEEQEDDF